MNKSSRLRSSSSRGVTAAAVAFAAAMGMCRVPCVWRLERDGSIPCILNPIQWHVDVPFVNVPAGQLLHGSCPFVCHLTVHVSSFQLVQQLVGFIGYDSPKITTHPYWIKIPLIASYNHVGTSINKYRFSTR
jgi:hypothetical protein